jgi:micrococcal nuclease
MQYNAKAPYRVDLERSVKRQFQIKTKALWQTHWKIEEVLDGDSIIICHLFTKMQKEIRLYGLDAPEVKYNRKMKEDEQKSQLPAQILRQLGMQSLHYVLSIAPPQTAVTIITEEANFYDYWKRQLGYVILPSGECLNDLLLQSGYAKATHQYYCSRLKEMQVFNRQAQLEKKGIYSVVSSF